MIKHFIVLSSSYSTGTRICMDLVDASQSEIKQTVDAVRSAFDGKLVSFSTHGIVAESESWESVVDKDPYFDDVRVVDSIEEFVDLIRRDRFLKGVDVARYILSKTSCTHTRLQKLTYMCYAEYLCRTGGEKLFTDKIFAFDYGPVVETVYEKYRDYSMSHSGSTICEEGLKTDESKMSIRSRLLFSEDGLQKVDAIDWTLDALSDISTTDLVDMTHRSKTPWSMVDHQGAYTSISDDLILAYHENERP